LVAKDLFSKAWDLFGGVGPNHKKKKKKKSLKGAELRRVTGKIRRRATRKRICDLKKAPRTPKVPWKKEDPLETIKRKRENGKKIDKKKYWNVHSSSHYRATMGTV